MSTTIFLAQLMGFYLIVMGFSLLIRGKSLRKLVDHLADDMPLIYITGIFTLLMGLTFVILHNVWTPGLAMVITIIAWLALLKGIFAVVLPINTLKHLMKMMVGTNWYVAWGIFAILLGFYLVNAVFAFL